MNVTEQETGFNWSLSAEPKGLAEWREVARRSVRHLGGDERAEQLAALVVSELLTNVIRHVEDPRCGLTIERDEDHVLIGVRDRSPQLPRVGDPDADDECESGRGLRLLLGHGCALDFGRTPEGNRVRATFLLVASAGEGDG